MKILWLSPVPSHPGRDAARLRIQSIGTLLKKAGHEIHFVLCSRRAPEDAAREEMNRFWTSFNYIKCSQQGLMAPGVKPDQRLVQNLNGFVRENFDAVICEYVFMLKACEIFGNNPVRIAIPHLQSPTDNADFMTLRQSELVQSLSEMDMRRLLEAQDIVIAGSRSEAQLLEQYCVAPVLLWPTTDQPGEGSISDTTNGNSLLKLLESKRKLILHTICWPYWDVQYGGLAYGLTSCVHFLLRKYRVRIFYAGAIDEENWNKLRKWGLAGITSAYSQYDSAPLTEATALKAFEKYLATQPRFAVVVTNHVVNTYLLKAIKSHFLSILSSHDLMSRRNYIFGGRTPFPYTLAQELELYEQHDCALLVEKGERARVRPLLRRAVPLYCPVPAPVRSLPFPKEGVHFGMFVPNLPQCTDPVNWFIKEVWSCQTRPDAYLHIFGAGCKSIPNVPKNVILRGVVDSNEEAYGSIHVLVNASLLASGISTQSIIALGFGRPVLSTPIGARGLAVSIENGFYVGHSRADLITGLMRFTYDAAFREQCGREAEAFARNELSVSRCYDVLDRFIESY